MITTAPDASGGVGSILSDFRQIATQGLSRYVDGYLSKKYPLGSFNDNVAVTAGGEVKPASAAQNTSSASDVISALLKNPYVVTGAFAIVGVLVILAVRR